VGDVPQLIQNSLSAFSRKKNLEKKMEKKIGFFLEIGNWILDYFFKLEKKYFFGNWKLEFCFFKY
jgi:hypothetical protein